MRVKKEIKKTCIDCKCEFIAYGSQALRCPECKKEHLRRSKAASQSWYRSVEYKKAKAKKKPPKMTIREILKEMDKYNKKHKTHYTYGKFVALLEGGEIDV